MINVLILVLICVLMGSFGQIYMKKGLKKIGGIELNELFSLKLFTTLFDKHVFLGLFLYALASLLWLVALSRAEVSFVYPLISLGYIVTALLARFYFNETITTVRWFGMLLIISGVFLVTKS